MQTLPSLFGLAPCGVYLAPGVTAGAVRSYRTISPLPRRWSFRNGERTRQAGPTRVLRFQGGPPERGVAEAVSFLWHWPSTGFEARVPDVIRHTALRSSDFPPPADTDLRPSLRQRPPGPPASPKSTALPVLPNVYPSQHFVILSRAQRSRGTCGCFSSPYCVRARLQRLRKNSKRREAGVLTPA